MTQITSRKTAIVAGGTAGVGLATVARLIDTGYQVGVLARGEGRLAEVENRYGSRVMALACDVSDADAVMKAAETVKAAWGPVDVWVNCAMLTAFSRFKDLSPKEFQAITDTTYHGQVWGTRAALAVMEEGNIVNIGSGLSYRSVPLQAAYCGAKHAINGFTSAVRSELIDEGRPIEISLVQLPAINTPQFDWARSKLDHMPMPAPPIFDPDVAARAVMKAIRTNARELFVGQSVLKLIAGQFLAPAALDRQLAKDGIPAQKSETPQIEDRDGNLEEPATYPADARGSFADRASDRAVIVNADVARVGLFGAVFATGLAAGALAFRKRR